MDGIHCIISNLILPANLFFGPIFSFKSKDIGMLKLHMIYDLID